MNRSERSAGIVLGKVIAVRDPERLGRIQVNYPWLSGPEQRWVPVAAPMAGGDRGAFFMPEVDDEVILAFDQGMWDHPYVIGFLWNPRQRPPSPDERQRMIRSRNGHALRMVDSTPAAGNKGALIIEDAHGNTVVMTNTHISINTRGALALNAVGSVTINDRLVRPTGGPI
ncbi:Gp5/Type VI secretion system Vgr protein OB-fold domain-containing protein [Cupriavidus oxalaticus]|uniref:phage baseplate assembly protein V n=1 Tax=Cupriavidus oxalaticus TaxID=96344 RepID=UPI003F73173F